MAIENSVTIEMQDGSELPVGNVIVAQLHFPQPQPIYDEQGNYTGSVIRPIVYDFFPYNSEADITDESKSARLGVMIPFPQGFWQKDMTPQEYADLLNDGTLAEVWLKDYIENIIGGTSTIIDPYD